MSLQGDIDNFISDNYMDILPGETVTVKVTTELPSLQFAERLQVYDKHMQRPENQQLGMVVQRLYPGTLFYLYEDTGDKELYAEGVRMLKLLEPEQYNEYA